MLFTKWLDFVKKIFTLLVSMVYPTTHTTMTNEKIPLVEDVANYIIQLANEQKDEDFNLSEWITHLKLQKLLYFTQATFLSCLDRLAFANPIVAYKYWPVVEQIFQKYSPCGRDFLDVDKWWDENVLSEEDRKAIRRVWEIFWWYSSSRLVEMTHAHDPWNSVGQSQEIPTAIIKEYYSDKIAF